MVILGLILVLIAVAIGAALLLGTQAPEVSGQEVDIRLFDAVTINLNPLTSTCPSAPCRPTPSGGR